MQSSHDIRLISELPVEGQSFKNLEGLDFYSFSEIFGLQAYAVSKLKLLPVKLAFLRYAAGFEIALHSHAEPQIKFIVNAGGRINVHDSGVITNGHVALTRAGHRYSATVETDTDLIFATLIKSPELD